MVCARCGSNRHVTKQCHLPFYKVDKCKETANEDLLSFIGDTVRSRKDQEKGIQEAAGLLEKKEKKEINKEVAKSLRAEKCVRNNLMCGDTVNDGAGVEWRKDPETGWWWWRDSEGEWQWTKKSYTAKTKTNPSRRNSVSSDEAKSVASTASTAATAASAAGSEEYKELQRMQQKLSEIAVLQDRKDRGDILSKYEESTVRRWGEFFYSPVMAKHREDKFKLGKGKGSA